MSQAHEHATKSPQPASKSTKVAPKPPAVTVPAQASAQNPSYIDARLYIGKYFRRQAELAHLCRDAARDGLQGFKIRSSTEYNDRGNVALGIFVAVLSVIPAAGVLVGTLHELATNAKVAEIVGMSQRLSQIAKASKSASGTLKEVEETTEKLKKGAEAVEKVHGIHEAGENRTETQERGEFEVETLSSIRDLTAETVGSNWEEEDQIEALVKGFMYVDKSIDLVEELKEILTPLPNPKDLKNIASKIAEEFELRLYLDFYVHAGKVTLEIEDQDGAIRTNWNGIPTAVLSRFYSLGKEELLLKHPGLRRSHITRLWSGNRV